MNKSAYLLTFFIYITTCIDVHLKFPCAVTHTNVTIPVDNLNIFCTGIQPAAHFNFYFATNYAELRLDAYCNGGKRPVGLTTKASFIANYFPVEPDTTQCNVTFSALYSGSAFNYFIYVS
jgi:hypothetical protein